MLTVLFSGSFFSTYYEKTMKLDSVARFFVSNQHWLYFVVMSVARFNLYAQSFLLLLNLRIRVSAMRRICFCCFGGLLLTLQLIIGRIVSDAPPIGRGHGSCFLLGLVLLFAFLASRYVDPSSVSGDQSRYRGHYSRANYSQVRHPRAHVFVY